MARIEIITKRDQAAHFGLYRTSAGGSESIFVRRKVGDPTDYQHLSSRELKRQREYLTQASQHYAHLTPSQKEITRHQIEEVEYQSSHGTTKTKVLLGRQLFIAKEMRALRTTQKQLLLPYQVCIMLVDEALSPLEGELWLFYQQDGQWYECQKEELATGNWLFSQVPPGKQAYRAYGEAEGYFDPLYPVAQAMTTEELRLYHYHVLLLPVDYEDINPIGDTEIIELRPYEETHWTKLLFQDTVFIPPVGGVGFGHFEGNYIWKYWHPWGYKSDLFLLSNPLYSAQYIYKLTFHTYIGRDNYPYGRFKIMLRTHGIIYYSDSYYSPTHGEWKLWEYPLNPHTNLPWTRQELIYLEAGMSMDKVGSFGVIMCDRLFVRIHYLPA